MQNNQLSLSSTSAAAADEVTLRLSGDAEMELYYAKQDGFRDQYLRLANVFVIVIFFLSN